MKYRIIHCGFFVIFLITSNILAQGVPQLNDLVKKIETACLPNTQYQVSVSQSIEMPSKTTNIQTTSEIPINSQINFNCIYNPQTGISVNNDQKRNLKIGKSINQHQANVRISVNLFKLFKNFKNWQGVIIDSDDLDGENCFKITAQDDSYGYIIWVDAVNNYMPKIIINIKGQVFANINITYNLTNNFWLPSKVIIDHTVDQSIITQNFSNYIFN